MFWQTLVLGRDSKKTTHPLYTMERMFFFLRVTGK